MNLVLLSLVALAAILKALAVAPAEVNRAAIAKFTPVAAVEALRSLYPPGNLFNSYNWGGYLLWALPEYPVFVDGRTDLYDDEIIDQWLEVVRVEPGWGQVLQRYEVGVVLIESGSPLDRQLNEHPEFVRVFADELAVVYVRR